MTEIRMDCIRRGDVARLTEIHREAFPDFFLTQLGPPFLRQFYLGFINAPDVVAVVARDEGGRAVGAAVGPTDPARFFRRLLRRRLMGFAIASLTSTLRSPSAAPRLLRGLRYRGVESGEAAGALLSSICVTPRAAGTGVGRELLRAWEERVRARGIGAAHLTTDAEDNERVLGFYAAAGWRSANAFSTPEGRPMLTMVKDFGALRGRLPQATQPSNIGDPPRTC